jgi:polysaccharide biosynthesis/export protein VpsN
MTQRAVIVLALSLLAAVPAVGQEPSAAWGISTVSEPFTLRPGDVLQIRVWREPDLGGDYLVDGRGEVVLPMLGRRRVADVDPDSLRAELLEAYGEFLRNPAIVITPLRRINVGGEVNRPGLYPVDPTITLSGAIGLAGGVTTQGDIRRIRVVREGRVRVHRADQANTLDDIDIQSGDQILVDRRSWFDRNSTFLVSALLSVTSVVTSIIIASGSGS